MLTISINIIFPLVQVICLLCKPSPPPPSVLWMVQNCLTENTLMIFSRSPLLVIFTYIIAISLEKKLLSGSFFITLQMITHAIRNSEVQLYIKFTHTTYAWNVVIWKQGGVSFLPLDVSVLSPFHLLAWFQYQNLWFIGRLLVLLRSVLGHLDWMRFFWTVD